MKHTLYILLIICSHKFYSYSQIDNDINGNEVVVFVNMQPNSSYHATKLQAFRRHIVMQLPANQPPNLIVSTNDTDSIEQHLILPAIYTHRKVLITYKWVLFVQEDTRLQLKELYQMLSEIDYHKPELLGSSMKDYERTIIHHFDKPYSIHYPHREVGFAMSIGLVNLIIKELEKESRNPEKYETHIDPTFELIKFIRDKVLSRFMMLNSTEFCLNSEMGEHCATWISEDSIIPDCGSSIDDSQFLVAVKTCKKFFQSRIPIIKRLWTPLVKNIMYFAEVEDHRIPTTSVGISNTESGHCTKLQKIFQLIVNDPKWNSIKYLVIVDDDTLLSVQRLKKLLYCYRHDEHVALGERYAYMTWFGTGYDYLTGGSGIVLSMAVVRRVSQVSFCNSDEWPDDMTLGMWLDDANQSITHSHLFHQARPEDYPFQRLKTQQSISFHKFWETDPDFIYQHYLNGTRSIGDYLVYADDYDEQHFPRDEL